MFATVNISQNPQMSQPQSGLDLLNNVATVQQNSNDFNTMQNMFATQNVGYQPQTMTQPTQPIGLATNAKTSGAEFNTMQNLFATGAYTMPTATLPGQIPLVPMNALGNNVSFPTPNEFNTMQNLFATGAQGIQQTPSNNPSNLATNMQNFNTMQNLFATGNPTISASTIPNTNTTGIQNQTGFNTMQNLFATGNQGGITMAQLQTNPNTGEGASKGNDFNTMQNLFATSNQPIPHAGVSQPNSNLQNINIQDFNTMQNLFKTGSGVVLPPPQA